MIIYTPKAMRRFYFPDWLLHVARWYNFVAARSAMPAMAMLIVGRSGAILCFILRTFSFGIGELLPPMPDNFCALRLCAASKPIPYDGKMDDDDWPYSASPADRSAMMRALAGRPRYAYSRYDTIYGQAYSPITSRAA